MISAHLVLLHGIVLVVLLLFALEVLDLFRLVALQQSLATLLGFLLLFKQTDLLL